MKTQGTTLDDIKLLIAEELKECNYTLWPKVCELQTTETGKLKLTEMIVRYIAEEGMGIGSAIAHIEQELAHAE